MPATKRKPRGFRRVEMSNHGNPMVGEERKRARLEGGSAPVDEEIRMQTELYDEGYGILFEGIE